MFLLKRYICFTGKTSGKTTECYFEKFQPMKVVVAAPESVHVLNYCEMMRRFPDLKMVGITEKLFENPFVSWTINIPFRSRNPFVYGQITGN